MNIASEPEEGESAPDPVWVWRRYANKQMRNKAKAYRRKRVVAGTAPEPSQRRTRYYRPIGRNGKVTRMKRLKEELSRDQQRVLAMAQQFTEEPHVHGDCDHLDKDYVHVSGHRPCARVSTAGIPTRKSAKDT